MIQKGMDTSVFLKAMVNTACKQVVWAKELPKHVQVTVVTHLFITVYLR